MTNPRRFVQDVAEFNNYLNPRSLYAAEASDANEENDENEISMYDVESFFVNIDMEEFRGVLEKAIQALKCLNPEAMYF